jgi:hypothetical protein
VPGAVTDPRLATMLVAVKELTVRFVPPRLTAGLTLELNPLPLIVIMLVLVFTLVLEMIEKSCALAGTAKVESDIASNVIGEKTRETRRFIFILSGIR